MPNLGNRSILGLGRNWRAARLKQKMREHPMTIVYTMHYQRMLSAYVIPESLGKENLTYPYSHNTKQIQLKSMLICLNTPFLPLNQIPDSYFIFRCTSRPPVTWFLLREEITSPWEHFLLLQSLLRVHLIEILRAVRSPRVLKLDIRTAPGG